MSLLYQTEGEATLQISEECYKDLALEELVTAISAEEAEQKVVRDVISQVPERMETVIYRQDILKDFIENRDMSQALEKALHNIGILRDYREHNRLAIEKKASVWDLLDYVQELGVYVDVMEQINDIFREHPAQSEGLKWVATKVTEIVSTGGVSKLKEEIKDLKAEIGSTRSVLLGVNLSPDMYPEEVKVLGFSDAKYNLNVLSYLGRPQEILGYRPPNPMMRCLSLEVEKELSKSVKKIKQLFKQYMSLDGYFLTELYGELKYYILSAKFFLSLREQQYAVCMPILRKDSKDIEIKGVYNLRLALQKETQMVPNDFSFTQKERLFILTGPNRGGKTILAQGIGLAAHMAAIGLFVCASDYQGFRIRKVLTHFPADENETVKYGRLGEEAIRIREIVGESDETTLALFNETYSTTSASDALYLAKDLLHVLKHKNTLTIFNTHIRELARETAEMNQWDGESDIVSIVMEIKDNRNTFRVLRSEPHSSSYARNIAEKYGITYEQMME